MSKDVRSIICSGSIKDKEHCPVLVRYWDLIKVCDIEANCTFMSFTKLDSRSSVMWKRHFWNLYSGFPVLSFSSFWIIYLEFFSLCFTFYSFLLLSVSKSFSRSWRNWPIVHLASTICCISPWIIRLFKGLFTVWLSSDPIFLYQF